MTALALFAATAAAGCVGNSPFRTAEKTPFSAEQPAKPAGDIAPDKTAKLMLNMAQGLEKDGKDSDALGYYEKAKQLDPTLTDKLHHHTAVLYDKIDQQDTAMAGFQAALAKSPKDPALLNDVGYSYYNRGKWAEAETYLRKSVDADSHNKTAWNNLGMTLAQQKRYDDAIAAWSKAVTPAEAQSNLGFILATQGKKDEARAAYKKALELEPTLRVAKSGLEMVDAPPPAPKAEAAATAAVK